MKTLIALSLLVVSVAMVGCNPDKSGDTQVMTPNGGVPMDAKPATQNNPNIPANVRSAIPGAGPATK